MENPNHENESNNELNKALDFIFGKDSEEQQKEHPVIFTIDNRILQLIPPIAIPIILSKRMPIYRVSKEDKSSEIINIHNDKSFLSNDYHLATSIKPTEGAEGLEIKELKLDNNEVYAEVPTRIIAVKAFDSNKIEIFRVNEEASTSEIITTEDQLFEATYNKELICIKVGVMQEDRFIDIDKEMIANMQKERIL